MRALHWFKLYHEIIDDPKMTCLSDRLWRRAIELFVVASKTRRDTHLGRLPPVEEIAFHLRLAPEEVEADLVELAGKTRIVELRNGHWFVRRFAHRQAPSDAKDRMQASRDRQRYAVTPDD